MTRREEIIQILSKQEISLQRLANHFRVTLKELLEDMEHVRHSIKPKKLSAKPAFCKKCGFVFKERSRIKPPTKCPRCKSEWIEAATYGIK